MTGCELNNQKSDFIFIKHNLGIVPTLYFYTITSQKPKQPPLQNISITPKEKYLSVILTSLMMRIVLSDPLGYVVNLLQKVLQIQVYSLLFLISIPVLAQEVPPANWFNLDYETDGIPGVSTEKAYDNLLKGRSNKPVVVAVLDSGVDFLHKDLEGKIWVNTDEIPNNNIDDDKNGYIDDRYGWNFLGNTKGENIQFDNLELTRQYVFLKKQFGGREEADLNNEEKVQFQRYKTYEKEIERQLKENEENAMYYGTLVQALDLIQKDIGKDRVEIEDLKNYRSKKMVLVKVAALARKSMAEGATFDEIALDLIDNFDYYFNQFKYYYNPEFDPRAIVGDNYEDPYERYYGNNNIKGPDAEHGTHVAGIIAANRENTIGIKGVADNVQIMSVRVVPDGDERDKDIANAIFYAVDNGASIINMSFGKDLSPNKDLVDKAIKYAQKKDVLMVHAAGNESSENFETNNFPNDRYLRNGLFKSKYADNWIEVGASSWEVGPDLVASFSNYSASVVDLFAPGSSIYSTIPEQKYAEHDGTSMAAPVVAGVAAILRSYFPELSASEVKDILLQTAVRYKNKVRKPGDEEGKRIAFNHLSVTGGIVNTHAAVEEALKRTGQKRSFNSRQAEISNEISEEVNGGL